MSTRRPGILVLLAAWLALLGQITAGVPANATPATALQFHVCGSASTLPAHAPSHHGSCQACPLCAAAAEQAALTPTRPRIPGPRIVQTVSVRLAADTRPPPSPPSGAALPRGPPVSV